MTQQVDGVDRALARFRAVAAAAQIERHALHTAEQAPVAATRAELPATPGLCAASL